MIILKRGLGHRGGEVELPDPPCAICVGCPAPPRPEWGFCVFVSGGVLHGEEARGDLDVGRGCGE